MDMTDAEDRSLEESIGSFEAAMHAIEPDLYEPRLERMLVVLDGSNQDSTVAGIAQALAERTSASGLVSACYTGPDQTDLEAKLQETAAAIPNARALPRPPDAATRKPFEQILALAQKEQCEIILLCAPYGENFDDLGAASVGSNLDLLLARAEVPLLVIREPKADPARCLQHLLVPITPYDPELVDAAAWTLRLAGPNADIRLLAVVDKDLLSAAGGVLKNQRDFDEMDERQLAGLNRPKAAGLIAAVQRHCAGSGQGCRVSIRTGDFVPIVSEFMNEQDGIVVAQAPRDPGATIFQRVQALTRACRNPVLVV
jgi:nucleotide-binding universal stress UspA family protein